MDNLTVKDVFEKIKKANHDAKQNTPEGYAVFRITQLIIDSTESFFWGTIPNIDSPIPSYPIKEFNRDNFSDMYETYLEVRGRSEDEAYTETDRAATKINTLLQTAQGLQLI